MKTSTEKLPKSAIKINVTVEISKVKEMYEQVITKTVEETDIEGFRKGKAPKGMVIEKVGVSNLYGDVINALLKSYYPQALKEHKISPLSNPRVEIKEFEIDKDFEFSAIVAVRPEIKIGEYMPILKESYKKQLETKKSDNETKIKNGEEIGELHVHMSPNEIIDTLTNVSEVEVPDLIIEEESEKMLSRLVDQAQSIGLSLEQYLKSQNKTADQLRVEYNKIAERNVKAEFVLGELVKQRDIEVEDSEIEATLKAGGFEDIETRMNNLYEKLYIKSILQKNKLISSIIEEIEGENYHDHKKE